MKRIKDFLSSLINDSNPNSAKVFAGLVTLVTIISLVISATIKNKGICPIEIFDGLLMYSGGCFGIAALEGLKKSNVIENVTNETDVKVDTPD